MWSDPSLVATARWFLEALSLAALLLPALYVAQQWSELPARVPSHFDWRGRPDRWAGRWILLVMLGVSTALYAGMSVGGHTWRLISGDVETRMREALVMGFVKLGALLLSGLMVITMVRVAQGRASRFHVLAAAALAALMIVPAVLLDRG
jgi:uncharacterized membrane protein